MENVENESNSVLCKVSSYANIKCMQLSPNSNFTVYQFIQIWLKKSKQVDIKNIFSAKGIFKTF